MGQNFVPISMAAPLQYLLITMKVVALPKSLFVIHKILRLLINTLTVHEKRYLLNRDNLTQPIQIKLSQKQKTFSQFFLKFLKSILNFKQLAKEDDPHSSCISRNTGF